MASLTGSSINTTYVGLLKTNDNAALTGSIIDITDGVGTATGIQVSGDANQALNILSDNLTVADKLQVNGFSLTGTNMAFAGAIDFAGATVTGLPGGAAGLVNGTGASSLQSAASLTTVAANASGASAIALGDSATAPNLGDVNIGDGNSIATKFGLFGDVVIGQNNNSSTVNGGENVLIGKNNTVSQNERNAAIGYGNTISRGAHYILGANNTTSSNYQIGVVGGGNTASGESSFIGGWGCSATARGAVALGEAVTASIAQTVSVKTLQTQTASTPTAGGILMTDAGSTQRRLNIDASGNLQVDSTPVGATPSYIFTTPVACPDTGSDQLLVSLTIPAGTFTTGDVVLVKGLWKNTTGSNNGQIWISNTNSLFSGDPVAVGSGSQPSVGFMKSLYIAGTSNSNWFDENFPADTGFGNFSQYNSTTLNWNNTVYVIFQGYVDPGNAGSWIGGTVTKLA